MHAELPRRRGWLRAGLFAVLIATASLISPTPAAALGDSAAAWQWPIAPPTTVIAAFVAPAHEYGPGHRGVDLAAPPASTVFTPAEGTIAFVGHVVDRDLITIDHGNGYVTTLEPVSSWVTAGDHVARGAPVGILADGGHSPAGSVHWGVRLQGEYVNPVLLLGAFRRPILLPCCE